MYAFCAAVNGACVINVPRRADFSLDVDAIERIAAPAPASGYDDFGWLETVQIDCGEGPRHAAGSYSTGGDPAGGRYGYPRPKLLFLCSPNNPDGGLLPAADLERLLRLPLLVVVDEAYIEFARPDASYIDWVAEHPNLVVLRTFSKWAGLGGLRVGYGVFPPAIIEQLWKIKQPYNVNVAGSRAAIASLADREYLLGNVARLAAERERLYTELARFDFVQPVPGSQSNFILCRVLGRDARQLKLGLEQQGVLVRHFAKPGVDNCIRISVGRPADSDALLAALADNL
jgi:histidinol-phosphate aminotransferase